MVGFFFIGLLVFIFFQVGLILSPFYATIFWAAILAFAFYPIYEKIRSRMAPHEKSAAVTTTLLIFIASAPLMIFVVANLLGEALKFFQWFAAATRDGRIQTYIHSFRSLKTVHKTELWVDQWSFVKTNLKTLGISTAHSAAHIAARKLAILTKQLLFFPIHLLLMFFLVFFFLKDGDKIYLFFYEITPLEESHKKDVFQQLNDTFSAVIRGQIVTAFAQAVLAGVIFWALGLPLPIFFAAATFLACLVPVFGAPLVWLPLTIYLAFHGHHSKAVVLFLLGVFVISMTDHILKPLLIGKKTKLPYLLLLLGILGGMQVYGLTGMFLAPAALSLFFVLIKIYRENFLKSG